MRDSFNNMLMITSTVNTLSGASNTAATFAAAAKELTQSAISWRDVESGSIKNSGFNPEQVQFNDLLEGELKSFINQQAASSANQKAVASLTGDDLTRIAKALQVILLEAQSLAESEPAESEPAESEPAESEPAESEAITGEIGDLNSATPEQLQQLSDITGVDSSELIELAARKLASEAPGSVANLADQPAAQHQSSTDLLAKIEQLIKPLVNGEQLLTQLAAIKQSLSQQGEQRAAPPIEQVIEQRVNQPIEELIRQPLDNIYDTKIDTKDSISVDSKADGAEASKLTNKIEALISQLPVAGQQQLVAMMKTNEEPVPAQLTPGAELAPLTRAPDLKGVADPSLSNLTASAMTSNQVTSDKKVSADKINANPVTADLEQESANINEADAKVKPKTADSFDNLIKQMEMTTARAPERSTIPAFGIGAESDPVTSQLTAVEKAQDSALGAKESLNQAKISTEQLLSKLPLAQDTAAAKMLKERITMMATGNIQQAVIQLDPEELGGMSIRLQIQNDQMSVQFQVQNSQAKEMLENAMVKLKEMLEQQGIVLKDSDVRQQDQRGQQDLPDQHNQPGESDDDLLSDQDAIVLTLHKQSSNGIDYYA